MLTIRYHQSIDAPVEVFGTSPDRLALLSLETIRRQKVYAGNRAVAMDSLFEIDGDPSAGAQKWNGPLESVHGIGHGMKSGSIHVGGSCGNQTGVRMTGGVIQVDGNTGNELGCEMRGGLIHVLGDAGDGVGSNLAGGQNGQNGGDILIEGDAGHGTGQRMRRGVIAITGSAGNCCGWLMRGGTIVVGGRVGKQPGADLRRGTLVFLQPPGGRLSGFASAGVHAMPMVDLLERHLGNLGFTMPLGQRRFELFHGDRLQGARGELLVAAEP